MFMLGFEDVPRSDRSMIMVDFDSHVGVMRSFRDVAEKQLKTGTTGRQRILDASSTLMSDDPYIVVIHLGYFYFLRFLLLTLHTDLHGLVDKGLADQVKGAANAVEIAGKKLNALQPGGMSYSSWNLCKEQVFTFIDSAESMRGDDGLVAAQKMSLAQSINETANLIANELRCNTSEEFVDMFIFMHLTKHLISQTNIGRLLFASDLREYLRVSCSLRLDYFSEELVKSLETIRCHFTDALDHPLDAVAIANVFELVTWQVYSFLDQVKPPQHGESQLQALPPQTSGSIMGGEVVRHLHIPTPDQMQTMDPDELQALRSQLVDLHESLQNAPGHSVTTMVRQVGSSHSELLPEGAAMATSGHLMSLVSSAMSEVTGGGEEKMDRAEKEKKDFEDERKETNNGSEREQVAGGTEPVRNASDCTTEIFGAVMGETDVAQSKQDHSPDCLHGMNSAHEGRYL